MPALSPSVPRSQLQAQALAGLAAALVVIPMAIGLGIFALAPLADPADSLRAEGARAGLVAVAVGTLIGLATAARARRRGTDLALVFAPGSMLAFLVGATTLQLVAGQGLSTGSMLACFALLTATAGLVQVGFGLLRLGNLVKYVPHPVIAGFRNAAALLLLAGQVDLVTGAGVHAWLRDAGSAFAATPMLGPVIAAVTFGVCRLAESRHSRVPAIPAGILAGTLLHHLLAVTGAGAALGPMVGSAFDGAGATAALSTPISAETLLEPGLLALLPALLLPASGIALLASLDTLLSAKAIEDSGRGRMNGNGLLLRAGAANLAVGATGGIPVTVSLASGIVAQRAGGLGIAGLATCCALTLLALALSEPLLALLPCAVVGGGLAFVALRVVDSWTLHALPRIVRAGAVARGRLALDLAIVALVTGTTLALDPVLAVGLGMVVALAGFVLRMSRSVVRRTYDASQVGSRRIRPARTARILADQGHRIRIFELQGAMFFGTAEQLADLLDALLQDPHAATPSLATRSVVLDLDRITEVDSTAGQLLGQIAARLDKAGIRIALAGIAPGTSVAAALAQHGVLAALPEGRVFVDVDRAIEWAEEALIMEELTAVGLPAEVEFSRIELFRGLDPASTARVQAAMIRHEFAAGQIVFREGDVGSALFVIASGTASVMVADTGAGGIEPAPSDAALAPGTAGAPDRPAADLRLVTFAPGTVFGELSLLDRERRSATVQADAPLVCFSLDADALDRLRVESPPVALALLRNLSRALAERMRRTNRAIEHLAG